MVDREAMDRAHALFDPVAQGHLLRPDVDMGRMFGTEGLRVRGKVYAFVGHEGALIVKVPRRRAEALAAEGLCVPMVTRGREMREWVTASPEAGAGLWGRLIDEAHDFVDEITPR